MSICRHYEKEGEGKVFTMTMPPRLIPAFAKAVEIIYSKERTNRVKAKKVEKVEKGMQTDDREELEVVEEEVANDDSGDEFEGGVYTQAETIVDREEDDEEEFPDLLGDSILGQHEKKSVSFKGQRNSRISRY